MAITLSGDSPNLTSASLTTPTLTSPTFAGTPSGSIITSGTAVASTSGTSITFSSIPSWVKRITVMFSGVSTSGTSARVIRLSTGGSFIATGYLGSCDVMGSGVIPNNFSTGFGWSDSPAAAVDTAHGTYTFTFIGNNLWVGTLALGLSNATAIGLGGGSINLGGTLDGVRITTVNGTDTFDAGTINILYE